MSRRELVLGAGLAGLGLVAGFGVLGACGGGRLLRPPGGQDTERVARLGWLSLDQAQGEGQWYANFNQALRELGQVEGQNIRFERRDSPSHEALGPLAMELVNLPVDIILTGGISATQAARDATSTLPIVQVTGGGDLVQAGLAETMARPGGNVTGLTGMGSELTGKRVELIKESVPGAARVAVLWNGGNPAKATELREASAAAAALGLQMRSLEIQSIAELERAFERATSDQADGLLVLGDGLLTQHRGQVTELAAHNRLPAIYGERPFMDAGGLMAYTVNNADWPRRAAYYVDRLLKGARPGDLPIERPMRFEFVVNMKAAQALGLTFPNEIMLQVTEVLQ